MIARSRNEEAEDVALAADDIYSWGDRHMTSVVTPVVGYR